MNAKANVLLVAIMTIAIGLSAQACRRGTISVKCGDTSPPRIIQVTDRALWIHTDATPDAIYAERGISSESVQEVASAVRRARADVLALTAITPRPFGIALALEGPSSNFEVRDDTAGRTTWVFTRIEPAEIASTLAHEWAHRLLNRSPDAAMLDEGFCELVSHSAAQRAGVRPSPVLRRRLDEVRRNAASHPPTENLTATGERPWGSFEAICKANPVWNYVLAFAYWLERAERRPSLIRDVLTRVGGRSVDAEDVIAIVDELSPGGLDPRAIDVATARQVLEKSAAAPW